MLKKQPYGCLYDKINVTDMNRKAVRWDSRTHNVFVLSLLQTCRGSSASPWGICSLLYIQFTVDCIIHNDFLSFIWVTNILIHQPRSSAAFISTQRADPQSSLPGQYEVWGVFHGVPSTFHHHTSSIIAGWDTSSCAPSEFRQTSNSKCQNTSVSLRNICVLVYPASGSLTLITTQQSIIQKRFFSKLEATFGFKGPWWF